MVVSVIFMGHFEELVKARRNLENVNGLISMRKVIFGSKCLDWEPYTSMAPIKRGHFMFNR